MDAVWEEEQVKFIEDNATACTARRLINISDALARMSRRSIRHQCGRWEMIQYLNVFFYDTTRTCVARFLSLEAGYATITTVYLARRLQPDAG